MSEAENLLAALIDIASRLNWQLAGEPRFGWRQKSIGSRVIGASGDAWLRVHSQPAADEPDRLWRGVEESVAIHGVSRPDVLQVVDWVEGSTRWRAEALAYVDSPICSPSPELRVNLALSEGWWASLRHSLVNLEGHETSRVNTRQDLLTRRLDERFPRVDPYIENWGTIHGDLHWGNLTREGPSVLDWEGWGTGPVALDAAFFRCFSLLAPEMEIRVVEEFRDILRSPDGVRSQLFACSELLRMTEIHGDHPDLAPLLHSLAAHLLPTAPLR